MKGDMKGDMKSQWLMRNTATVGHKLRIPYKQSGAYD